MSKLIEDMYRGNFIPFGEQPINIDEYSRKAEQLLCAEKDLLTAYPECKELLERFIAISTEVSGIAEYHRFLCGFKAGAQLAAEMLLHAE